MCDRSHLFILNRCSHHHNIVSVNPSFGIFMTPANDDDNDDDDDVDDVPKNISKFLFFFFFPNERRICPGLFERTRFDDFPICQL